jgi:hypothetical protein
VKAKPAGLAAGGKDVDVTMNARSIAVSSPKGKCASPYRLQGDVLIKNVHEKHIFRARWAVGIDEAVWEKHKKSVRVVRFEFPDGSVRQIPTDEFDKKSFLHGDGITFAKTRFVRIGDLELVREAPPSRGQLALALGVRA